ncbi:SoxR reducing system RseC family protein [Agathobaculum sp.]|uniref:SoxR reducing system RseC family protein n=1 Tax=Agathobaculum sp. TaxID=2048138 RepID=UPI002A82BA7C|nr:SoxR reducing system RseC family protein [Agathobaculum sp.]MDY3618120.1 SoxR reducing system RseC family protein [Agathobaculum sp.]
MTQQAKVKKLMDNDLAEVEVVRQGACMHDCAKCGGCDTMVGQTITVTAKNAAGARTGDRVMIEGETRQLLSIAVLVYLLPLVLFFVGFACGSLAHLGEGLSALAGGVLFVIGVLAAMQYSRTAKARSAVTYRIIERL